MATLERLPLASASVTILAMNFLRVPLLCAALFFALGSASNSPPPAPPPGQGYGGQGQGYGQSGYAGPMRPQVGPWFCHHVVAQSGGQIWLCGRTYDLCNGWASRNGQSGFVVDQPCQQSTQASCFVQDGNELCTGQLAECESFRTGVSGSPPSPCQTIWAQ
jgi:hypothetical protein